VYRAAVVRSWDHHGYRAGQAHGGIAAQTETQYYSVIPSARCFYAFVDYPLYQQIQFFGFVMRQHWHKLKVYNVRGFRHQITGYAGKNITAYKLEKHVGFLQKLIILD